MLTVIAVSAGIGSAEKESDGIQEVVIVEALRDGVDVGRNGHEARDADVVVGVLETGEAERTGWAVGIGGDWPRMYVPVSVEPPVPVLAVPELGASSVVVQSRPSTSSSGVEEFRRGYTDIEAIICSYPWPCHEALAVAWCESRFDPQAIGGDNYGLFQVNAVHAGRVRGDLRSLLEPHTNTRVAYAIYIDNAGWGPWACQP